MWVVLSHPRLDEPTVRKDDFAFFRVSRFLMSMRKGTKGFFCFPSQQKKHD